MEAGREMDGLIGCHIMNLQGPVREMVGEPHWRPDDCPWVPVPKYSTDIVAAMEVVDKLHWGWGFAVFRFPGISSMGYGYVVAFAKSLRPYSLEIVTLGDPKKVKHGHSDSLPHAICLAAYETTGKRLI